jgi:hypothetical protein
MRYSTRQSRRQQPEVLTDGHRLKCKKAKETLHNRFLGSRMTPARRRDRGVARSGAAETEGDHPVCTSPRGRPGIPSPLALRTLDRSGGQRPRNVFDLDTKETGRSCLPICPRSVDHAVHTHHTRPADSTVCDMRATHGRQDIQLETVRNGHLQQTTPRQIATRIR